MLTVTKHTKGKAWEREEGMPPAWLTHRQDWQSPPHHERDAQVGTLIGNTCFLVAWEQRQSMKQSQSHQYKLQTLSLWEEGSNQAVCTAELEVSVVSVPRHSKASLFLQHNTFRLSIMMFLFACLCLCFSLLLCLFRGFQEMLITTVLFY